MELRNCEKDTPECADAQTFKSTNRLTAEVSEQEYDPFHHRAVEKPTSDYGAFAHLLKSSLGSGILAMPMAFQNGGVAFGVIGTVLIGFLCTHCVQMLVDSAHTLCQRARLPMLGFAETAETAFSHGPAMCHPYARAAKISTQAGLVLTCLMGNSVYLVLIGTTIDRIRGGSEDIRLYILMIYIPLVALCLIRDLKHLVPFSVVANICMVVVFGITLYYTFDEAPDPSGLPLIASYDKLPLFFSTVIFAMEGIGVVMPIENAMKTPQNFTGCPGVLNMAMAIIVFLYTVIGFFGYVKFRGETEPTITLNVLWQHGTEIPAQVVQYLIAISIFFTYALQFYVPVMIIWDAVRDRVPKDKQTVCHYVVRVLLVTSTVILAIAVPNLGPIISLVGAVCFSMLGLFLPSVIDIVTRWDEGFGKFSWILWKDSIIAVLAIIALTSGAYASILEITSVYSEESDLTVMPSFTNETEFDFY